MSRYTPLQWTLIFAFCVYWFLFFPLMWFVVRPNVFVCNIWQALLFAVFLFLCYCVLHMCIICCSERCQQRQRQAAATPMKHVAPHPDSKAVRVHVPDAVLYEKPHCCSNAGACTHRQPEQEQPLRFISSYELYYDGRKFQNDGSVKKI